MARLLLATLLVCSAAAAQQRAPRPRPSPAKTAPAPKIIPADPSQRFPLRKLSIRGAQKFLGDQILALTGLKIEQSVSKADFDTAQKLLLDTGLFETVAYKFERLGDGYEAYFEVKEVGQLFPYRFEAIDADQNAMRAWLHEREPLFKDEIPATEPVLKRMSTALEAYLAKAGRPMPIVGRLSPGDKQMEIVFLPSSLPAVAEIKFTGNKTLTNQALQQAIAGAAVGALYTENRFRQILNASIRPVFEAEGRLRVTFPKLETAPAADVKGVVVTVHVDEGDAYKLHDVILKGQMADDKPLLKRGKFRTGEVVNMAAVQDGVKDMEKALRRRGYISVSSDIERKLDDKQKTVDVIVDIDPGPQFKMGQLIIEGLDIQTEPHIRKLWAMKPNQPFDSEYPDLFLSKMPEMLDNLGKTKSLVKPDPGTLKVDVTLLFEGEKKKPEKPKDRRPSESPEESPFPNAQIAEPGLISP